MNFRYGLVFTLLACGMISFSTTSCVAQEFETISVKAAAAEEEKATDKTDADKADEKNAGTEKKPADRAENKEAGKAEAEKKDEKASDEETKRETLKIEPKKFETEVAVDGTFVARKMTEVELRPEEWSSFEIVEIVPHGATIREGEMLVKFDSEDLNEAIVDLEREQRLSELALRRAEDDLPRQEKLLTMNLEEAEKQYARALEDQKHYEEVDRELEIKSAKYQLKNAEEYLQYEKDELDQLQKMYDADDLTEETEEIILTRQKSAVESAQFYVEQARIYHDRAMKVYLPRRDVDRKERLEQARIALERAKLAVQVDIPRARYDLEKAKHDRVKSLERHSKLTKDKSLLTINSPADGIVYYGSCVDGQWSDMSSMISKLQPKNSAPTNSILFTIVSPRPMYIVTSIDEKNRPDVKEGLAVEVKPVAESDLEITGKVAKLSPIPVSSGKFSLEIELKESDMPDWLVPGMSNKVTINTYTKKDAIVVPKKTVHDDEDDKSKKFVWVVDEKDPKKPAEKREVKLGRSKDEDVEIVSGLKAGDVISLEDEAKKQKEAEKKAKEKEAERK